ncbi:hypothetical protein M422DRAFT_46143 [Sphaerobolus stellatus SS14]|nr:hypothetical protein M422DRAFT_46143 [Sphaerobolus stellatus SS14]
MTKTILITGCSSGVGLAAVKLFYEKGWNVVGTVRSVDKAPEELKKLDSSRFHLLPLDVSKLETIPTIIQSAIEIFGKIDVLYNNAGYSTFGILETVPLEQLQEIMTVNFYAPVEAIRAILPHFRAHGSGIILNTSSGNGYFATPISSLYCASKHALEGFTEGVSYELASQNILIKNVVPYSGISSTKFVQSGHFVVPKDPEHVKSYGEFFAKTTTMYGGMATAKNVDAADVAEVAYQAATDGTNRLRYFLGTEDFPWLDIHYNSKNDEAYMEAMRKYFP